MKTTRYEFDGHAYSHANRLQCTWGDRLVDDMRLAGTERILDIGCGDGAVSERLAQRVPHGHVTGIDASAGMISEARNRSSGGLAFELRSIEQLADSNEQYDVIFSNAALHWVVDHDTLLQQVYEHLKPGGVARFSFGGAGNCAHLVAVLRQTMRQPTFAPLFEGFVWPWYMPDVVEYTEKAVTVPFSDVRVWEEPADEYFASVAELIAWIDQPCLVPFVQHLGQFEGQRFRDRVVAAMLEWTAQPDGTYFEQFRRLHLYARK